MIYTFLVLTLLNINVIMAEENCTGDYCVVNGSEIEKPEEINCDNFHWVENYLKKELQNETNSGRVNVVSILKNANYNLQADLNESEGKAKRYYYAFWITLIFLILFIIYFWIGFDRYFKKHPTS